MKRVCWFLVVALLACGDDDGGVDAGLDSGADAQLEDAGFATHESFTVESPDGLAVLTVAPNSLPLGVEPSDIRIEPGAAHNLEPADGVEVLIELQLLPDGVVFREPAVLELTHSNVAQTTTLLLISEGTIDGLDWEPMNEGARLVAQVPHFSDVVATRFSSWFLETTLPFADMVVGGPGVYAARLQREPEAVLGTITDFGPVQIVTAVTESRYRPDWEEEANHTLEKLLPDDVVAASVPLEAVVRCTGAGIVEGQASAIYEDTLLIRTVDAESGEELARTMTRSAFVAGQTAEGECEAADPETPGNCNDSESARVCSYFAAHVDIVGQAVNRLELDAAAVETMFGNTAFECGEVLSNSSRTVCTAAPSDVPVGGMWSLTTKVDAPIPTEDRTRSYIYAAVFESDDNPDNDWRFVDPFDHDYFQGTDRWYQLIWDHTTETWSLTVTQVSESQTTMSVPSAARVFITGDTITWYIPETELPSSNPEYRLSAFGHDGAFNPDDRGGDVTGVDPTAPLYEANP